jgi:SAM-dependent methyltransferase
MVRFAEAVTSASREAPATAALKLANGLRLDLGAGAVSPQGFVPLGNVNGTGIYPLPYGDATVDEIRASHVLEHFGHREVPAVLADWVRVLKPGGRLRVAVPDFGKIAEGYVAGKDQNTQGYVMGGQTDGADFHKVLFDRSQLARALAASGLMLIREWTSELADCAALPISLNLEGTKPHHKELTISAVMSMPRLSWTANAMCWVEALYPHGISPLTYTGAFWEQCLERCIEQTIKNDNPDLILSMDYDSIFTKRDVGMLIQLMAVYPEADAIAPIQAMRGANMPLLTMAAPKGADLEARVGRDVFASDLAPLKTAHFGLTMFRRKKLAALPKPWLRSEPAPDGSWNDGRSDADIAFWRKWHAAGNTLYAANRVAIGHLEVMIRWPAEDMLVIHQDYADWRRDGTPKEVWR